MSTASLLIERVGGVDFDLRGVDLAYTDRIRNDRRIARTEKADDRSSD